MADKTGEKTIKNDCKGREMLLDGTTMPGGYTAYGHQVAGHRFEEGEQGMLLDGDGKLLKPIQAPPRGEREAKFYQTVFGHETSDQTVLKLRPFVPTFYGIKHVVFPELSFKDNYLILEDLTRPFNKPCVLDVKIGRCVTDHLATQAKKELEERKYPEQEKFGFRILGMKIYNKSSKHFQFHNKTFGKTLKTHEDVLAGLKKFFCQEEHGNGHVEEIVGRLKSIKTWFLEQRIFRLYSSSILIIYEGNEMLANCLQKENPENNFQSGNHTHNDTGIEQKLCAEALVLPSDSSEGVNSTDHLVKQDTKHNYCQETSAKHPIPRVSVHLVDFAHAYVGHYSEPDENYLYGLYKLIHYFEQIMS